MHGSVQLSTDMSVHISVQVSIDISMFVLKTEGLELSSEPTAILFVDV